MLKKIKNKKTKTYIASENSVAFYIAEETVAYGNTGKKPFIIYSVGFAMQELGALPA